MRNSHGTPQRIRIFSKRSRLQDPLLLWYCVDMTASASPKDQADRPLATVCNDSIYEGECVSSVDSGRELFTGTACESHFPSDSESEDDSSTRDLVEGLLLQVLALEIKVKIIKEKIEQKYQIACDNKQLDLLPAEDVSLIIPATSSID